MIVQTTVNVEIAIRPVNDGPGDENYDIIAVRKTDVVVIGAVQIDVEQAFELVDVHMVHIWLGDEVESKFMGEECSAVDVQNLVREMAEEFFLKEFVDFGAELLIEMRENYP